MGSWRQIMSGETAGQHCARNQEGEPLGTHLRNRQSGRPKRLKRLERCPGLSRLTDQVASVAHPASQKVDRERLVGHQSGPSRLTRTVAVLMWHWSPGTASSGFGARRLGAPLAQCEGGGRCRTVREDISSDPQGPSPGSQSFKATKSHKPKCK